MYQKILFSCKVCVRNYLYNEIKTNCTNGMDGYKNIFLQIKFCMYSKVL